MPNYYRDCDVEYDGRRSDDDDRHEDYRRIHSDYEPDRERHNRGFPDGADDQPRSWFGNHEHEHSTGEDAGKWSESRRGSQFARRGPRGYRRSDKRIREDVGEYLARHGRIDAGRIEVSVDDGEVTLSGIVGTREEKRLAENVTKACPGVKEVCNKLRVNQANGQANENQPSQEDAQRDQNPWWPVAE